MAKQLCWKTYQVFNNIVPLDAGIINSLTLNPYAADGFFVQYKMMQKPENETLANGYSYENTQQELPNEYPHDFLFVFFEGK